jgi:hypothetical protein
MRCGYGVILTILAIGASTAPGGAVDVPYSKGVVSFNDATKVTVGVGGDYANCNAAIQSFSVGGSGGIIEFLPGDHVDICYAANDRGNLMITGQLGPNGERPRITTPSLINPNNGKNVKDSFITFLPRAANTLVVENLEIHDSYQAINAANYGGAIVRNVFVNGTSGGDGMVASPASAQYKGQWPSWFEIYDSEVTHAGGSNSKHNIYLTRIDEVYIDGLYSHSARNSQTLKVVAREATIVNSTFRTTDIPFADLTPDEEFLSTTLIDIASCSTSVMQNNTFVGASVAYFERSDGAMGSSTSRMIDLKRRRNIAGCDNPAYESTEFNDPAFWENAAALGYNKDNDALFTHDISGNTFINDGTREIVAVANKGTLPIDPSDEFQFREPAAPDLPTPDGWFERSVAWVEGNTIVGAVTYAAPDDPEEQAPLHNLDLYDVVGITPGAPGLGPTMSNIQLTLTQSGQLPQANLFAGTATALVSVSEPPALWVSGAIAGCFGLASLVAGRRNGNRPGGSGLIPSQPSTCVRSPLPARPVGCRAQYRSDFAP